jgi:hypothetical protein
MKRRVVLALLLVASTSSVAMAAEGLGLFVGANHFIVGDQPNTFGVNEDGLVGGLLIPVHLSGAPLFVKIKAVYHGADYVSPSGSQYDSYMHASNSFLVGVKTWRGRTYSAQVLLGPGIQNESAYAKWGVGVSAAEIFVEASLLCTRDLRRSKLGLIASLEQGLTSEDDLLVANQRAYLAVLALF